MSAATLAFKTTRVLGLIQIIKGRPIWTALLVSQGDTETSSVHANCRIFDESQCDIIWRLCLANRKEVYVLWCRVRMSR